MPASIEIEIENRSPPSSNGVQSLPTLPKRCVVPKHSAPVNAALYERVESDLKSLKLSLKIETLAAHRREMHRH
tara:strand:- start:251 stop:472 length:222 start_codon:yes stop_codon:yes gene_type:complete